MFDTDLKKQLTEAFSSLENTVELVVGYSTHQDQNELLAMLNSVAETSEKIKVAQLSEGEKLSPGDDASMVRSPHFKITLQGKPSGVIMRGIPGGHEFTSLVLAILHSDGKGKKPDPKLIDRIRRLKGPIRLKTFVSLSCENCPEVVQALNLMAILHKDFQHEMIDGGYFQEEIGQLGIQGVPSIVHNNKMIHSGKINLLELIGKLELIFGAEEAPKKLFERELRSI